MSKKKTVEELRKAEPESIAPSCPGCGCQHTYIVQSKPIMHGEHKGEFRRLRECRNCSTEFWKTEKAEYLHNGRIEDGAPKA